MQECRDAAAQIESSSRVSVRCGVSLTEQEQNQENKNQNMKTSLTIAILSTFAGTMLASASATDTWSARGLQPPGAFSKARETTIAVCADQCGLCAAKEKKAVKKHGRSDANAALGRK